MSPTIDRPFLDDMVIPLGKTSHISGTGVPGHTMRVDVASQSVQAQVADDGSWTVRLAPVFDDPGPCSLIVTDDVAGEECSIHDVRFGQVYLLGGQSNIEYRMRDDDGYEDALACMPQPWAVTYTVPQIDYVDSDGAAHPADQAEGTWEPLTAETLGDVSAVGYHALQRLHQEHPDTVFAIVDCFKGGTSATCWVPREKLDDQRLREAYVEPFDVAIAGKSEEDFNREERIYDESVERHNTELSSFQEAHPECSVSEAKDVVGHTPWPPPARPTSPFRPCGLYETMFGTVSALAFTAVVWYQGEDDTGHSNLYRILLERLISSWREALGDAALTFYVIQLPGYADGIDDSWAEVREAQLRVCEGDPHAFLVSIADTGEEHNIHPTSKKVAGTRLGTILGDELEHGTPVVSDVHDRGRDVIIDIRDSEGILAGETSTNAKGRGADGVWKPISILTETSSPQLVIERGVDCSAIRYGYENYPRLSIYDESGMPLAPFSLVRTQGEWKLE